MIYLKMGILILEIGLCMLLNNLLKNTLNKKIRYAICCIALLLNCLKYAYVSSYVSYTYTILLTNPIINIQKKKTNSLHNPFSHHVHIHRYFWFCEYVYHPSNHLQHHNHKRNHKHQISIYLAKTSSMNPHPKKIRKSYLNNSKGLLK